MAEDEFARARSTQFIRLHPTPLTAEHYIGLYRNYRFSGTVKSFLSKTDFLFFIFLTVFKSVLSLPIFFLISSLANSHLYNLLSFLSSSLFLYQLILLSSFSFLSFFLPFNPFLFVPLHFTSLHFTSLHFTSLHFTSPHFYSQNYLFHFFISLIDHMLAQWVIQGGFNGPLRKYIPTRYSKEQPCFFFFFFL